MRYTQEQVAEAVSISTRWYQEVEKGAVLPSGEVTLRLLLFLGLDPELFRAQAGLLQPAPSYRDTREAHKCRPPAPANPAGLTADA